MALQLPKAAVLTGLRLTRSLSSWSKTTTPIPSSASAAVTSDNRNIHLTTVQEYPQVAPLPLPDNVDPNETIQFSQERSRDINCHQMTLANDSSYIDVTCDNSADPHMASYDARGMVNLNCTMQSNVPEPFGGGYKFTHLNMPGGQWAQNGKFMAQDLQASHYTNLRQEVRSDWDKKGAFFGPFITTKRSYHSLLHANTNPMSRVLAVAYSTKPTEGDGQQKGQEAAEGVQQKPAVDSKKMRLKQAFKEYGSTIVVFHVGISLVSLGSFYALVSSGLDVVGIVEYLNLGDSVLASKTGAGASTFVIAYAVHKVFAPVRISITLGATPFLVRMMRKRGILKKKN